MLKEDLSINSINLYVPNNLLHNILDRGYDRMIYLVIFEHKQHI